MADRLIVVGVDGTTTGLRAVAWAAKEALLRARPLRLVHAAPYLGTPDDPAARGRADAVLARARPSPTRSHPSWRRTPSCCPTHRWPRSSTPRRMPSCSSSG